MTLDPKQIEEVLINGGTITGDNGEEIEIPKDGPSDSGNKALLALIAQQHATIREMMAKPPAQAPAAPAAPAPTPKAPTSWTCDVMERDKDGRVKRIQMNAWEAPRGI